ncbi:MAG: AAA family ATPase [Gammaproteobacteria bacterium]|nr:AAA family ATPase [Gammaproteobacteria bacterium]
MNLVARKQFGLAPGAWRTYHQQIADGAGVSTLVRAAIDARAIVAVTGERGSGKSVAVARSLAALDDVKVIAPVRLARDRLHVGDIEDAIIRALSDERPRRSGEARSQQVRRLLGHASGKHHVVLLIDDAHALHHSTLRALKRLMELTWMGRTPLLSIVLVCQHDVISAISELALRSDQRTMLGLSAAEVRAALGAVLGERIEAPAIERIARQPGARAWLDLQRLVDDLIVAALAVGERVITAGTLDTWECRAPRREPAEPSATATEGVDAALARHAA